MSETNERFTIAQIGRTVGLKGDMKLNLHTDFPDQFRAGATLQTSSGELKVLSFNKQRMLIKFAGYESIDDAKPLTNTQIFSDKEQTLQQCNLSKGEYFWFDIIGSEVYEDSELLGVVEQIDRMMEIDYLAIKTDKKLTDDGLPKSFLLPYIPRYIISFESNEHQIITKDAKSVLEAS